MKNIVMVIVSAILGALTLMIVMTVDGRMNRSMELKSSLPSVVEETVEIMAVSQKYSISNTNEFLADLIENLAKTLGTKSDITVDILKCDKEKGILTIKVTEEYTHPNGKPGTVECERNVILNKVQEEELAQYKVEFYVGAECYKKYVLNAGQCITAPVDPILETGVFQGWKDSSGYLADFTQPVTQDMIYYAVW